MKSTQFALVYITLTMLTLAGCSDDDSEPSSIIEALIDGREWSTADAVSSIEHPATATLQNDRISISGVISADEELIFYIDDTSMGTYSLGGISGHTATYYGISSRSTNGNARSYSTFNGTSTGQVVITELTENRLKGTFYLTAFASDQEDYVEITEGDFNVELSILK